jgi:hypothetical protein
MNTSALGAVLGAIALAGVAILYFKVDELSADVDGLRVRSSPDYRAGTGPVDEDGRIRIDRSARPAPSRTVADTGDTAGAADGPARLPETLEERVARLEKAEARRTDSGPSSFHPARTLRMANMASSVDQLAKTLRLTANQKDRVADAVARGRRRIEDVLKIPDESGKSPFERRKEQRAKLKEAIANNNGGGIVALSTGLFADRGKKIPGRNTTYGEEIDRIKNETRQEIAQTLDPEQKKQFDETNVDPMLGGGGGAVAMTVWSSETPAAEEGDSDQRVLVGGLGIEVEAEDDGGGGNSTAPADGDR